MAAAKGTIIVTGANGGLGSGIVRQIVSEPEHAAYHGIYLVRDVVSAAGLHSVLASNSSHTHDILSMDLTDMDSVRQTASVINSRVSLGQIPSIKALILNAGYQDFGKQTWTKDGLDTTFSANYLGHWLMTLMLLESMDKGSGRIVLVGSQAHDPNDKRNVRNKAFIDDKYNPIVHDETSFEAIAKGHWSSAHDDPSWKGGFRRYGAAKLFLIMMMYELQSRVDKDPTLADISILAVDPGSMSTGLQRHASWLIRVLMFRIILPIIALLMPNGPIRTTQTSASHILKAAFDSDQTLGQFPKELYFDGLELVETSDEAKDAQKRVFVWRQSKHYAGLKEGETVLVNWK
ncbi:Short-chain dehydrogenase TIC 32-like chloroplastic protein [Lachnellula suecica]|uniref:Short-chain dehydrogenase TIC 32-like chloroplastic protein n=1 Tax=Lachnellula suecica TaxID=602035 RepID=A0A8T9C3J7_9HELO|nr:Short-chain dehydrogenase TIC 32-like chloroplastic protein [Lachnellula suecica]